MNHKQFKDMILDYLANQLDLKEELVFQAHFMDCDKCMKEFLLQKYIFEKLQDGSVTARLRERAQEIPEPLEVKIERRFHGDMGEWELSGVREYIQRPSKTIPRSKRLEDLIDYFQELKPKYSFPCRIYRYDPLGITHRGTHKDLYTIGERIVIVIEPPKDGYLTILHYDEDFNLNMIFPSKTSDDTFVEKRKDKRLGIEAQEPIGKHYLMAIWTTSQIIDPKKINFANQAEVASTIGTYLNSLAELKADERSQSLAKFEVFES